jgi:hypothetical protein
MDLFFIAEVSLNNSFEASLSAPSDAQLAAVRADANHNFRGSGKDDACKIITVAACRV